ncbi:hypothetical protein PTTG_27882 [Puccinia triticina 1-1 BBBD Race 1]|uniref:HAT C-terminal dimerisation domain-containing protein n=1 Tax=Puccinia triticina (isolate 1-1 / race 1 (BBBD)) TaxID=630390 RepID=A0A180GH42_PUCT1|nr:hypothetical protein PTTG_27882 [Puccinia triticina 1-1 BBBD Race 1]
MANPEESIEEVPQTPPNIIDDPTDVPQSTRWESSRLRTPISQPGFVATQSDSRRALINVPAPKPARKKTAATKIVSVEEEEESDDSSDASIGIIHAGNTCKSGLKQHSKRTGKNVDVNLSQDSDDNNKQVTNKKRKDKTKDRDGFDHPLLYFYGPGEPPNKDSSPNAYLCCWCPNLFKATSRSNYNLKSHRNGSFYKGSFRPACPGCLKAIKAKCMLPPSAADLASTEAKEKEPSAGNLIACTLKGRYNNDTLNKLIVIWLVRHLLPWLCVEDFLLRVCFDYAVHNSQLHSCVWVAMQAHVLYLEQQKQVLKLIKASESKISLVSNVWTTKGSHKAFVGMACCYINKDWTYTTDSGSNNFTMAKAVAAKFRTFDLTMWDVSHNHHCCICHVIALILGAGLKALNISKAMVRPEKTDQYFPILDPIAEADETRAADDIVANHGDLTDNEEIDPDNAEAASREPGWEWDSDGKDIEEAKSGIAFTLKKLDYICRRISSSPQKQAEWKLWADKLEYKGRGLIGGYGIRWNIAYDSRQRAYEGRRVIKQLLENESDLHAGKSANTHFFKSYEWEHVNNLNQVLKEFLEITKQVEGDGPKLPMVLYEYVRLLDSMERKKVENLLTPLRIMFDPMIKILKKYINLALNCDTVILATYLHPAWRMMLFANRFSSETSRITQLRTQSNPNTNATSNSESDGGEFNYYPTNPEASEVNTEMDRYNNGDHPMDKKGDLLGWWKPHSPVPGARKRLPCIGIFGKGLSCLRSQLSQCGRTFSAAAGVCATGRTALAIRTIERCISSHMWLRNSVELSGASADCQDLINQAKKSPKFAKYTKKSVRKSQAIRT